MGRFEAEGSGAQRGCHNQGEDPEGTSMILVSERTHLAHLEAPDVLLAWQEAASPLPSPLTLGFPCGVRCCVYAQVQMVN